MHTNSSAPRPARQPYERPEVLALGRLRAVTGGPDQTEGKNLDMLWGGRGGFARQAAADPS